MKRNGKPLPILRDGHPRRMADGRNAWRKMSMEQRVEFLEFIAADECVEHFLFTLKHTESQRELESK